MSGASFILCAGVVYIEAEDGTSRLLDLGNRFYGLSVVATRMLRATLDAGPEAAAEQLARVFGVPLERVRSDLTTFLVGLERKRLIRRTSDRRIAARASKSVTWAAVVPMLWGRASSQGSGEGVAAVGLRLAELSIAGLGAYGRGMADWVSVPCDVSG